MPIIPQRLVDRTPPLCDGFCGLEQHLYASDRGAERRPPHVPGRTPRSVQTRGHGKTGLPLPPPPMVHGHVMGVPSPVVDDPRGLIPVYATYRIVEDPRA